MVGPEAVLMAATEAGLFEYVCSGTERKGLVVHPVGQTGADRIFT